MSAPRPLHIGMFADSYVPEVNGVVISIVAYAEALRARGHTVTVVAPDERGAAPDPNVIRFASQTFPLYPEYRMAFPAPASALRSVEALALDVVHAHSIFVVGAYGAWLAKRRGLPLIHTFHTLWTEYTHYSPLGPALGKPQAVWLNRRFCDGCDRVIAPTDRIRDVLRNEYRVGAPIDVLPSGLSRDVLHADPQRAAALRAARGGAPAILYAGRLGREKNLEYLIDAVAAAHRIEPRLRVYLAGSGPLDRTLQRRASALGVASALSFIPALSQRELADYYAASDAFVFASTSETQGLVLLEAMAHGLPVVAVASGVSREVVAPDAGLVIEGGPDAFGAAVAALLRDEPRRRAFAQAARRHAAPYRTEHLVEHLEAIYAHALVPAKAS